MTPIDDRRWDGGDSSRVAALQAQAPDGIVVVYAACALSGAIVGFIVGLFVG